MMLEGSGKSELWSKSIINPVPKKGDPSEPHNKRGIALIPTAAKIYIYIKECFVTGSAPT